MRPFVTSCRVLNRNPRPNAHFIAFFIGEHATGSFISPFIRKSDKFYSLILMVLCYSMITCQNYVLLWLACKFLRETGFAFCFDICQIIDRCSPNCAKNGNIKIYSTIHVVQVCLRIAGACNWAKHQYHGLMTDFRVCFEISQNYWQTLA